MSYFRATFAVIPSRILYLPGVQLSYIRVYSEIYNLWHSNNPCFLGNPELAKRIEMDIKTVKNALKFFEDNGEIKRVQKGNRRYIVQPTRAIETDSVDNSEVYCTNSGMEGKLVPPLGKVSSPQGGKLGPHKDKILNTESNKSSCPPDDEKEKARRASLKLQNEKKHDFSEKPKAPLADVTKQSTSFKQFDPNAPLAKASTILEEFMSKQRGVQVAATG